MISRIQSVVFAISLSLFASFGVRSYRSAVNAKNPRIAALPVTQGTNGRTRIAAGEYQIIQEGNDGGIGSYVQDVYNFRESWTLWRLADGSFEVEGKREYESPRDDQHSNLFTARLAADFRTVSVKEFRKLQWRPDSGPLSCEFQPTELMCSSGAKDPSQAISLNMPMKDAYGFLWPISAFSLSSITRHAAELLRN